MRRGCTKKNCTNCGACSGRGILTKPLFGGADAQEDFERRKAPRSFAAACDLGTTTLACYLVDMSASRVAAASSARNPQAAWGADVISRIVRSMESEDALQDLAYSVRRQLENLLAHLARNLGCDLLDCRELVLAGNSVMEHLFLGISPASLGSAPFVPLRRRFEKTSAGELGMTALPALMPVRLFPLIDGFVGGDTAALLFELTEEAAASDAGGKTRLVIDFGTNGEIAILRRGRISTCSTAAGPAFEGAAVRQGMPALPGAVHSFESNGRTLHCHTVQDTPARGLCGSGLTDAVALLLREGVLTPEGRMEQTASSFLARKIRGEGADRRCVLCESEMGEVALYQRDVREFQLAKGAVQAGIELLLEREDVRWEEIDECVLAGAFGNAIRHESLLRTGLLRSSLKGKIRTLGNGAGLGAVRALLSGETAWKRIEEIAATSGHLRLESEPDFESRFLEAMRLAPR
jgi:uncharacterized 2Fe-2S/4Fe-4S cluster protein (DUF4445 family)